VKRQEKRGGNDRDPQLHSLSISARAGPLAAERKIS
jgi:hypothetical protein